MDEIHETALARDGGWAFPSIAANWAFLCLLITEEERHEY